MEKGTPEDKKAGIQTPMKNKAGGDAGTEERE
jgi:hypothetical protein